MAKVEEVLESGSQRVSMRDEYTTDYDMRYAQGETK